MTPLTLEQAFEVCQNTKTAWLTRKQELADTEKEYRELIATGDESAPEACKHCATLST